MRPRRDDDAVVDLLDVLLRDGVVIEADVIVTVADVALVGIKLRAAVAGMTVMNEYGVFDWRAETEESRRAAREQSGRHDRVGVEARRAAKRADESDS